MVSPAEFHDILSPKIWVTHLDESQSQSHYFVGGALATQDEWDEIDARFDLLRKEISEEFDVPEDIEFHAHPLMGGQGAWQALRGKHREAGHIYEKTLRIISEFNVSFYIRGVDVGRLKARYSKPDNPHLICQSHLLERINDFAKSSSIDQIIVVADETSQSKALQDRIESDQSVGTGGYRSSYLEHISSPLNFVSSADTSGIQVIDLVLYLKQREYFMPTEKHAAAQRIRNRLLRIIEPQVKYWLIGQNVLVFV